MTVWTGDDSPEGDGAAQLLEALAAEVGHGPGGVPRIYNDDYWRPGCMCDFEGHTRTGCTHDS